MTIFFGKTTKDNAVNYFKYLIVISEEKRTNFHIGEDEKQTCKTNEALKSGTRTTVA